MQYKEFTARLLAAQPDIFKVTPHAGYMDSRDKRAVGIVFVPDGKVYEYTGSYTDILERLGVRREWQVIRMGEILGLYYTEAEAQARIEKERAQEKSLETAGWGKAREITVNHKQ